MASIRSFLWMAMATAFLTVAVPAQLPDRCGDILRDGVFDSNYIDAKSKRYHLFQRSYCNASSSSDQKSLTQALSYLNPQESFSGTWNASSDEQRRSMFCDASLDETFEQESIEIFIREASPVVVNAWSECMKRRAPGAQLSARYSNDLVNVSLEADSGVTNLPLSFDGKTALRDQINILPPDALTCERPFSTKSTRDTISCTRSKNRLNEVVQVQLLTHYGERPITLLPTATPPERPVSKAIKEYVYLSKELEIGKHNFQYIGYELVNGLDRGYAHGVRYASHDSLASAVTYRIPFGATSFKANIVSHHAGGCGGGGPVNGWRVTISAPSESVARDRVWNYIDPFPIAIPLSNIPYGAPRELTIQIDPHGSRTCDHSALGDPHFEPAPPAATAAAN